jgi:WD40 repeat protein
VGTGVTCVTFTPNGKMLAAGFMDGTTSLWDVPSGTRTATLGETGMSEGRSACVYSVVFSPDGKRLAVTSDDLTIPSTRRSAKYTGHRLITLWDVASAKATETLDDTPVATAVTMPRSFGAAPSAAFSPDGKTLAFGSAGNTVVLWNLANGHADATLRGHRDRVISVAFSPDGKTLASTSGDQIKLWEVATRKNVATIAGYDVHCVRFSPEGKSLASVGINGISVHDVADGGRAMNPKWNKAGAASCVAFSPDAKVLATGRSDDSHTIDFWDAATGKEQPGLPSHTRAVSCVAFSPDGEVLASGSADWTVRLWNVRTGTGVSTIRGKKSRGHVCCVAFSPDGKTLVSGSSESPDNWEAAIEFWDLTGHKAVATFGDRGTGACVAFSPDGKTMASATWDRTIRLWDVEHRKTTNDVLVTPMQKRPAARRLSEPG